MRMNIDRHCACFAVLCDNDGLSLFCVAIEKSSSVGFHVADDGLDLRGVAHLILFDSDMHPV